MPARHTARQPGTPCGCLAHDAGSPRTEAGSAAAPSAAALTNQLTVCHQLNLAPTLSVRLINQIPVPEPPGGAAFQIGTCHRDVVPPLLSVTRPSCRGRAARWAARLLGAGDPHLRRELWDRRPVPCAAAGARLEQKPSPASTASSRNKFGRWRSRQRSRQRVRAWLVPGAAPSVGPEIYSRSETPCREPLPSSSCPDLPVTQRFKLGIIAPISRNEAADRGAAAGGAGGAGEWVGRQAARCAHRRGRGCRLSPHGEGQRGPRRAPQPAMGNGEPAGKAKRQRPSRAAQTSEGSSGFSRTPPEMQSTEGPGASGSPSGKDHRAGQPHWSVETPRPGMGRWTTHGHHPPPLLSPLPAPRPEQKGSPAASPLPAALPRDGPASLPGFRLFPDA